MAPRKAPRNVIPDQKPSPRATRLRPRRGVAQEVEQQAPTPAPSTKTSTRTTTRKPAAKSTAAPKATPKAGSKSYKVTKPRGKTAAKNRKTTTDDAPSEPLDTADPDDVATTEDAPTDAPADLVTTKTPSKSSKVAKTPAKTTAKTPSKARSSKKAKSFEPEQQFVRTTRRSVQQGWQSPLSDQAQTIIGLLPKNQTEQESTPLSIVNESNQHETDEKQNEWFTPRSPAPYASAQKSAQKSTEKSKNKSTAGDEDELPESSLGQPDDDDEEAMSDGSDEATDGQDDEMDDDEVADAEAEAHADADAASAEGTPRPETPPEEPAAPTTPTSNYYLAGLFNTGKSIFKKINPFGSRTPAPAPTSPTVARSSRRPGPVTPRIKNADERHSLAEANKEKSDQIRREKEAQAAQAQEAEEIAQQQTDDTRRWSIPAHPPGLRGYGVVEEYFDMDDATLDERYPYKRKTTADESSPVMTPATKRRKVFEELENEDPRFKEPIAVDTAFDVERAEEDLEGTLRRPRNALRRHFERTTGKDLGDKHHQTKIQHHENSFSRSPLRDSQSSVNRRRSNDAQQSSPSTIYRGSTFAVPGDPGYKSNVFKSSDMQISAEQREQTSKREDRTKRSWWKKIPRADMKARAKEIVVSWNETGEISAEDKEYFEIAERRCGHIKGSGSFCSIDLETDDESDSETEADTDSSFEAEPVASTGPKQASPIMPVVPTPAATTPATPAAKKPLTGILKKPASAMVPPPTPKPANAQLPTPTAAPETPKAAVSQSPAKKQPDLSLHPSATPSKEQVNLDPDSALDRVRKQAEKHKPGRSTKMSQMMRVASSPLQPSSPVQTAGETENPSPVQSAGETENSMSKSLITQGTDLPAVQDDPASAFKHYQPFVPTSGSLPWSSPMASPGSPWSTTYGQATSKQPAETSRLAGNDRAAGENYKEVFRDIIEEAEGTSPTPSQKRKRFEEESDAKWSDNKKPKTLPITDKVDEQVYKARCDFLTARENRLTAACPSDALNSFISSKCRARYEANWHALLARKYATA
ncbi:hypothetical protein HDK64DRAFT_116083 [Phyllosticta capitalensis]